MRSKKRNQKRHAIKRFKERLSIDLTKCLEKSIIQKIRTGRARFMESRNSHTSVFLVPYSNKELKVVYDNRRKVIVTVLP